MVLLRGTLKTRRTDECSPPWIVKPSSCFARCRSAGRRPRHTLCLWAKSWVSRVCGRGCERRSAFKSLWTACPTRMRSLSRSATSFCTSSNGLAANKWEIYAGWYRENADTDVWRTMHHVRRSYTRELRAIVDDAFALADECVKEDKPVVVDQ